jgi:hypothetical protein
MAAQLPPMFDARLEGREDWIAGCVAFLSNMYWRRSGTQPKWTVAKSAMA